ncbi:MAG: YHYH protein [Marinoscillum sp.]
MFKSKFNLLLLAGIFLTASIQSCESLSDENDDMEMEDEEQEEVENDAVDISILAEKFYNNDALVVTVKENVIVIESTNEPDHKSMYYAQNSSLYEPYDEPNNPDFKQNPNSIETQDHVYTIPRYPVEATSKETTPFGPMGISVNSVAFFNQNAAPGDDILEELNTFDQYEGHPAQGGNYHYHIEPVWLTEELGDEAFLGLLLDGFPVYGPKENGKTITNDDLDDYHGHTSATAEFPEGIYHYHITDDLPWINGDGFYGTPGTITQ